MPVCAHLPCHTRAPCCEFTLGLVPTRANFTAFASGIWVSLGGMRVSWPGVQVGRAGLLCGWPRPTPGERVPACERQSSASLTYTQHERGTG